MSSKIIATIHSVFDEAKGPSYSVKRLYEEIYKTQHNVILVDADKRANGNCLEFGHSCSPSIGPAKLCMSSEMYQYLDLLASNKQIALLHNHGLWMMPNVYPGWIAKKYKLPLITSPRGTFSPKAWNSGSKIKKVFWPLIQKPALTPTTCFHATAYSEYEDIRNMGYKQPVAIIPNGIDIPFGYTKQSAPLKTLLFLGRIHPIKGLDMLLPAWQILQKEYPDWQLKIVGPDNDGYLPVLKTQSQKLQLQRIQFIGGLYEHQKWQAYHDADLYILPTYSENFAMSVAEALASGTPAVVTKGAPWRELEEVNAGKWVDIDTEAITDGLRQMMKKSSAELMIMGQNGKQLMQDKYSWQHIATLMTEVYEWVMKGGSTPSTIKM